MCTATSVAASLEGAAGRAAEFLRSRQCPEGFFCQGEVLQNYKLVAGLAALGEIGRANRLLNWLEAHRTTAKGRFRSADEPPYLQKYSVYRQAWILSGAAMLGRWDVASTVRVQQLLLANQDPETGGFFGHEDPQVRDVFSPTWNTLCGWACLLLGRWDSARLAADALVRWYEAQPDPDHRLFLGYHYRDGLCTSPIDGPDAVPFVDTDRCKQLFFNIGAAMALLCQAAMAFQEPAYCQPARRLAQFASRWPEEADCEVVMGKVAVGMSFLWQATREERFRELTIRFARNCLLALQNHDGSYPAFRVADYSPGSPLHEPCENVTAEFARWDLLVAGNLQGEPGAGLDS